MYDFVGREGESSTVDVCKQEICIDFGYIWFVCLFVIYVSKECNEEIWNSLLIKFVTFKLWSPMLYRVPAGIIGPSCYNHSYLSRVPHSHWALDNIPHASFSAMFISAHNRQLAALVCSNINDDHKTQIKPRIISPQSFAMTFPLQVEVYVPRILKSLVNLLPPNSL
jgi:hypothetical protein